MSTAEQEVGERIHHGPSETFPLSPECAVQIFPIASVAGILHSPSFAIETARVRQSVKIT
jgi:hypothetical protein